MFLKTYPNVQVVKLAGRVAHFLKTGDATLDEMLRDAEPGLHVRLAVLLGLRIVEFQGTEACTSHEKECDNLDVLDVFLGRVLCDPMSLDDHMRREEERTPKTFKMSVLLTTADLGFRRGNSKSERSAHGKERLSRRGIPPSTKTLLQERIPMSALVYTRKC